MRCRPVRSGQRTRRQAVGVVAGGITLDVRIGTLGGRRDARVHAPRRDVHGQRQDQGGTTARHVLGRCLVRPRRHVHRDHLRHDHPL